MGYWAQKANIKGGKGDPGEQGDPGPQGLPGTNAVPADTATGGYIGTDGSSVTKSALISRAGFLNAKTDTAGGVAAALAASDHTAFLRAAITTAQTFGFKRVFIPMLDTSDPSRPWILSDQLNAYAGLTIDASEATFRQTVITNPAFYVPAGADNVSIDVGYGYLDVTGDGTRPFYADFPTSGLYNGVLAKSNCAGIMSDAQDGDFRGHFAKFRFGVRLSSGPTSATTDADLRKRNKVHITVEDVDWGIVYSSQAYGDFWVEGSYLQMSDSPDPAHLLYATASLFPSKGCKFGGNAWDGVGDVAFSIKGQSGAIADDLIVRKCPGILNIVDPLGPILLGNVHGTDILTQTFSGGGAISAVWSTTSGLVPNSYGTKMISDLRISFDPTVTSTGLRALSMDDDWTVGTADISYRSDEVNDVDVMVAVTGNRSFLGPIKIRNEGAGGIRGLRYYTGTSGHYLSVSPQIIGGTDGVTVDTNVTNSVLSIDEQTISPITGYVKSVIPVDLTNTIRPGGGYARRLRKNRWFSAPFGPSAPIAPVLNNLCVVPVVFQRAVDIDKLGLSVTTAVAASTVRMGIYADAGNGYPGALILDGGTVDSSTTGAKTLSITRTTLPPGTYWLAYVLQGATGVMLRGLPLESIDFPAGTQSGSIAGIMPTPSPVSGALPTTWVYSNDSVPGGVAKVTYEIPS